VEGVVITSTLYAMGARLDTPTLLPIVLPQVGRRRLPTLFRDWGFTRGAEIGVWKGEYSAALCAANPNLGLICVDGWAPYPDYFEQKNTAERLEQAYQVARQRLAPYHCAFIRKPSHEAAPWVLDGSLDFVYIDGNHTYEAVMRDLACWVPKVRPGGVISGHDFGTKPSKHIDVERAVRDFTEAHAIAPWFLLAADDLPSFLWVNP
jgi:hypothetical protein